MPDPLPPPDSQPAHIDSCLDALKKDLSINQRVYNATERALGEIARMYYPTMASWEPELLSMLTDRIRSVAHDHSLTLANLEFTSNHPTEEKSGAGQGL